MMEFVCNGKTRLHLPADINLNIVDENPLFLTDRIPAPYSLSFNVPATADNQALFGYPQRVASNSVLRKVPAELRHSAMIIARGELLLLEATKTYFNVQFKGSLESADVRKNLNEIDFGSYDYGSFPAAISDFDYWNKSWATSYKAAMKAAAESGTNFVVAPVKIEGADDWFGSPVEKGAVNMLKQYINFFNPADPSGYNLWVQTLSPELIQYYTNHAPIFPFPYIKDLINTVFNNSLINNPFDSGDYAKLVAVTFNHPNYDIDTLTSSLSIYDTFYPLVDDYSFAGWPAMSDLKFAIKSFMQQYAFNRFLKDILAIFSMTAFPGTRYTIEKNNDIFDRSTVVNWDDKLAGDLIITEVESQSYEFTFGENSDEDLVADKNAPTAEDVYDYMKNVSMPEKANVKDNVSGAIWEISRLVTDVLGRIELSSSLKKSALAVPKKDSEKIFSVQSDIKPLDMSIEKFWWYDFAQAVEMERGHFYVPKLSRKDVSAAPHIMIYAGLANAFNYGDVQYPLLLNHHTDQFGTKRLDLSLLPEGNDGLIATHHNRHKAWIEKDRLRAKGSFRFTPAEIRNIDKRDKIYLKGRLFYIEKLEYSLTHRDVSLVEAELVEC